MTATFVGWSPGFSLSPQAGTLKRGLQLPKIKTTMHHTAEPTMYDDLAAVGEILDRQLDDGDGNGGEFQNSANATAYVQDNNYTVVKKL